MTKTALFLLLISLYIFGCKPFKPELIKEPEEAMIKLNAKEYPVFKNSSDLKTLKEAIEGNFIYLNSLEKDYKFKYGKDIYSANEVMESFQRFIDIMNECGDDFRKLNRLIKEEFYVYRSVGNDGKGDVFFTGYFVPQLNGSLKKDDTFRYPLYLSPEDRVIIDLGLFREKYKGEKLVARYENNRLFPYYSHEEIYHGALKDRGLELVWVNDIIDMFFLHIQGSGIVKMKNGEEMYVGYDSSNGHVYRSIGKLLLDEGKLNKEEISMQSIKKYLKENPGEIDRVLLYNPSYVFFKEKKDIAIGYVGVPLIDARAIATDTRLFPQGALAFVEASKPEVVEKGEIKQWVKFSRFVLNQDTGGAIKGPGRVDFFWGKGEYAEIAAGHMKHQGRLYFLVKKK